jgi:hypothetical protein
VSFLNFRAAGSLSRGSLHIINNIFIVIVWPSRHSLDTKAIL